MSIEVWIGAICALLVLTGVGFYLLARFRVSEIERQHPPAGEFIEIDGLRLHYVVDGPEKAHPIVLIHGASGNLNDFRYSLFGELAKSHRVYAFDRPGHGYSERPKGEWPNPTIQAGLIKNACGKLGIQKPLIIGHSYGGAVAAAYGLAHPENVTGLVLLAPALYPWDGGVASYQHIPNWPILGWVFSHIVLPLIGPRIAKGGINSVFDPDPTPHDYAEAIGVNLLFRPKHFKSNAEDVRNLRDFLENLSQQYNQMKPPVLILTGNRDQIVLAKLHSYQLAANAPDATMVKYPGTGHMPHHVHLEDVTEKIREFSCGLQPQ